MRSLNSRVFTLLNHLLFISKKTSNLLDDHCFIFQKMVTLIIHRHNGTVSHFSIIVSVCTQRRCCDLVTTGMRNNFGSLLEEVKRCKDVSKEQKGSYHWGGEWRSLCSLNSAAPSFSVKGEFAAVPSG